MLSLLRAGLCLLFLMRMEAHLGEQQPPYHGPRDTLVLYHVAESDAESMGNLRFFLEEAVVGDGRCDYVLLAWSGCLKVSVTACSIVRGRLKVCVPIEGTIRRCPTLDCGPAGPAAWEASRSCTAF